MNRNRLNGTAKLDLVAHLTRLFAGNSHDTPPHGHALSQHTVPTGTDPNRWVVRHPDPVQNYAFRRRAALANRTRNRRKLHHRMSPTVLRPSLNQPYVLPANRKAAN